MVPINKISDSVKKQNKLGFTPRKILDSSKNLANNAFLKLAVPVVALTASYSLNAKDLSTNIVDGNNTQETMTGFETFINWATMPLSPVYKAYEGFNATGPESLTITGGIVTLATIATYHYSKKYIFPIFYNNLTIPFEKECVTPTKKYIMEDETTYAKDMNGNNLYDNIYPFPKNIVKSVISGGVSTFLQKHMVGAISAGIFYYYLSPFAISGINQLPTIWEKAPASGNERLYFNKKETSHNFQKLNYEDISKLQYFADNSKNL